VSGLSGLAVGDFNGDGKVDFAAGEALGGFSLVGIFLGNGDGTFQTGPTYPIGDLPEAVVVGDFNGDKREDLAIATLFGGINVLLGNGNGTFKPLRPIRPTVVAGIGSRPATSTEMASLTW